ncbi:MAG: homoserine kinase [Actinomycetota bacterium]
MKDKVVVRVPATRANLGPGFDAMGLAMAWYDEIKVERHDGPLQISASGLRAEGVKRDESNGIVTALRALGEPLPGLRIHKMTAVPFGRGFGSSAISIVGGLVAARALLGTSHTNDELLKLAIEEEGHADNVAPALLGGVVVSAGDAWLRFEPPGDLLLVVCAAPMALATRVARAAIPEQVSRETAVYNVARAALLAAALATGSYDALFEATDDRIHQPPRFELMPESAGIVRALRARSIAAFLSGAGPSVAAFAVDAEAAVAAARAAAPEGWDCRIERIDPGGAAVVDAR